MFEWLESIKFSPRYECLKTGDFGLLEEFKRRAEEMILDSILLREIDNWIYGENESLFYHWTHNTL